MNLHISLRTVCLSVFLTTLPACGGGEEVVEEIVNSIVNNTISNVLLGEEVIEINLPVTTLSTEGGRTFYLEEAVGSGAFHYREDANDEFYTVTDRGPMVNCVDSPDLLGIVNPCRLTNNVADENGKISLLSDFVPTIYKLNVDTSGLIGAKVGFRMIETIPLKDRDGNNLHGLPPSFRSATTDNVYDRQSHKLASDPNGLDPEALIKLTDGTFWIAEEYGPSLIHLAENGRVLERVVPYDLEMDLSNANYQVTAGLPGILKKRQDGRGVEGLAVSTDEHYLYFILQAPLANPNDSAKKSRYLRLFKVNLRSGNFNGIAGEYVYVLDQAATFTADDTALQSDVNVSELVALDTDRLLVVEHVRRHTKIYQVPRLQGGTNIFGSHWDDEGTYPSLETSSNLVTQGVMALDKKLVFNSPDDLPTLDANIEGLAILSNEFVAFLNDNEFSIKGEKTRVTIRRMTDMLNR